MFGEHWVKQSLKTRFSIAISIRAVVSGGCWGCFSTQNLKVLLTLFQPEGADYSHYITASTPGFENLTTALSMMQSHLFLIGNLTGIHLGLRTYVILLTNKVDKYLSVNLIRCEILYTQTNCFIIIRNVYNDNHSTQTCITNVITLNYLSHQAVVRQM